mgnify:CR=1 FL=1
MTLRDRAGNIAASASSSCRVEGPAISFVSTPKGNLLSFTQVNQLPDVLQQRPIACTCSLLHFAASLFCSTALAFSLSFSRRSSATSLRHHGTAGQVQGPQDGPVVCYAASIQSSAREVRLCTFTIVVVIAVQCLSRLCGASHSERRSRYGTSEQQMMEVETTPAPESPVNSTTPPGDEPVASEKKEPAARPKRRKSPSSTPSAT